MPKCILSVEGQSTVEIAALKLSALCRGIGFKMHDGTDPGDLAVAEDIIEKLCMEVIDKGPGSIVRYGMVRVVFDSHEGDIQISIELGEFYPETHA